MMAWLSYPPQMERKRSVTSIMLSLVSPTTAFASAFEEFQRSVTKEGQKLNTVKPSHYNLRLQSKE